MASSTGTTAGNGAAVAVATGDDEVLHPNLVLPPEILEGSPSKLAGVSAEAEVVQRVFGCEVIQEAGILLDLYVGSCVGVTYGP